MLAGVNARMTVFTTWSEVYTSVKNTSVGLRISAWCHANDVKDNDVDDYFKVEVKLCSAVCLRFVLINTGTCAQQKEM